MLLHGKYSYASQNKHTGAKRSAQAVWGSAPETRRQHWFHPEAEEQGGSNTSLPAVNLLLLLLKGRPTHKLTAEAWRPRAMDNKKRIARLLLLQHVRLLWLGTVPANRAVRCCRTEFVPMLFEFASDE